MQKDSYKGLRALVLENDRLRLTFLPDYGCKMASLVSKKTGREFLFQSLLEKLAVPPYGANFSEYDSSGFDEVFPSIDACLYPDAPYQNVPVPDHGETWTLPWHSALSQDGKELTALTRSRLLPYIFTRKLRLRENQIQFEYSVTNTSDAPFKFIWTPHCLLACSPHTRLLIPAELNEVVSVEKSTRTLGPWGAKHAYPIATSVDGNPVDLAATLPASDRSCEKFYFTRQNLAGWAGVEHTDTGEKLIYRYDAQQVPYLGVWKTQGGYRGDYNLALEPCTGVYDSLEAAARAGTVAQVEGRQTYSWRFEMTVE